MEDNLKIDTVGIGAETEAHFHKIFNYSNDAIFVVEISQNKIMDANPKACQMLGYPHDELLKMSIDAIHPSGMMPKLMAFSQSVMKRGHGWTNELTCLTKAGIQIPAEISASVIDFSGSPCLLAMVRDITDRKQAESALRESEDRLSHILESAMDAIITLDQEGNILLFNVAAEKMFGCSVSKVTGSSLTPFLSEPFSRFIEENRQAMRRKNDANPSVWISEGFTAIRENGEIFPIEASLSSAKTMGQILYTLILRDINDQRKAEKAFEKVRLANRYLRDELKREYNFGEIVGKGGGLRKILEDVKLVAETDSTVSIAGETGTGKELIARAVHHFSKRKEEALIKINCATLPTGLIESELFGHEKGAFTGAISRKIGRFELADGGTIFLDEIGDLPQELQPKLLRVLQEGEFERVGGTQTFFVNVRVITATNRDLKKAVAEGRFRADLYYRLNVFPVTLPPLRDRKEDIPLLTQYFLNKYVKLMGRKIEAIGPETIKRLIAYPWPGNVRELAHVIERAVILSKKPILEIQGDFLPASSVSDKSEPALKSLEAVERAHIIKTLDALRWVVEGQKGAAKVLNLHPNTLRSRMQKLDIRRDHDIS